MGEKGVEVIGGEARRRGRRGRRPRDAMGEGRGRERAGLGGLGFGGFSRWLGWVGLGYATPHSPFPFFSKSRFEFWNREQFWGPGIAVNAGG
jgi:hypothetical protein